MPQMNFDLEDGKPPVSFVLKPEDCARFVAFMRECDEGKKNAERYRRLRDGQNWPAVFGGHDEPEPLRGAHLDAAIDAELALHNASLSGQPCCIKTDAEK